MKPTPFGLNNALVVKKVMVERLPESCFYCNFAQPTYLSATGNESDIDGYRCLFDLLHNEDFRLCNMTNRPSWCILESEDE